jgi:hypothetical protein
MIFAFKNRIHNCAKAHELLTQHEFQADRPWEHLSDKAFLNLWRTVLGNKARLEKGSFIDEVKSHLENIYLVFEDRPNKIEENQDRLICAADAVTRQYNLDKELFRGTANSENNKKTVINAIIRKFTNHEHTTLRIAGETVQQSKHYTGWKSISELWMALNKEVINCFDKMSEAQRLKHGDKLKSQGDSRRATRSPDRRDRNNGDRNLETNRRGEDRSRGRPRDRSRSRDRNPRDRSRSRDRRPRDRSESRDNKHRNRSGSRDRVRRSPSPKKNAKRDRSRSPTQARKHCEGCNGIGTHFREECTMGKGDDKHPQKHPHFNAHGPWIGSDSEKWVSQLPDIKMNGKPYKMTRLY